jgi:hypothetical protein
MDLRGLGRGQNRLESSRGELDDSDTTRGDEEGLGTS